MTSAAARHSIATFDPIVRALETLRLPHPTRVAVDGRTASGKTTFADALAAIVARSGRQVIRASIDGFHHSRAIRHRQGRLSPDGYYEDARDLDALRRLLLDPLGPEGDRLFVREAFDLERDAPLDHAPERAADDAILIVDGTFLQRPELRPAWDLVIFLDVPEAIARQRGLERDSASLGGAAAATELYALRYGPAFARYESEHRPRDNADLVIHD